jgi:hypothetical protein
MQKETDDKEAVCQEGELSAATLPDKRLPGDRGDCWISSRPHQACRFRQPVAIGHLQRQPIASSIPV